MVRGESGSSGDGGAADEPISEPKNPPVDDPMGVTPLLLALLSLLISCDPADGCFRNPNKPPPPPPVTDPRCWGVAGGPAGDECVCRRGDSGASPTTDARIRLSMILLAI